MQHNLDHLPFLWLTRWDNTVSEHLKKVCRCQQKNRQRIMNWRFHCAQSALLQYLVPFFGNTVLGWQQMKRSTKRRGMKHPGCCRHTLPPQDAPLWSPWLGGCTIDAERTRQTHKTTCSDVTILDLKILLTNFYWQYLVYKKEMKCIHHLKMWDLSSHDWKQQFKTNYCISWKREVYDIFQVMLWHSLKKTGWIPADTSVAYLRLKWSP